MMSDIGQKLKDTLGYGETTPVKTDEVKNLQKDEKQPAELSEVMDDTEGGDGEEAESSTTGGAKGKE